MVPNLRGRRDERDYRIKLLLESADDVVVGVEE